MWDKGAKFGKYKITFFSRRDNDVKGTFYSLTPIFYTYKQGYKTIVVFEVGDRKEKMSWFHHICDCGCNIHDVEYTNEGVILTCKRCGKKVKK